MYKVKTRMGKKASKRGMRRQARISRKVCGASLGGCCFCFRRLASRKRNVIKQILETHLEFFIFLAIRL